MFIHQIVVYANSGICIAQYPSKARLEMITSFFSAMRSFSISNRYGDVSQIRWMNRKASFLYSRQRDLAFALVTDVDDDDDLVMRFLSRVRDEMIPILPERANTNTAREGKHDGTLKSIVDTIMQSFNHGAKNDVIFI